MTAHFKSSLVLFAVGLSGVISLLFVPYPPFTNLILALFSVKWVPTAAFIGMIVLVTAASLIGALLAPKVKLHAPLLETLFKKQLPTKIFLKQLMATLMIGCGIGGGLRLFSIYFSSEFPLLYRLISWLVTVPTPTALLFSSMTEEIILRWGFMTLMVWLVSRYQKKLTVSTYLIGMATAVLIFALGQALLIYLATGTEPFYLTLYLLAKTVLLGGATSFAFWRYGIGAAIFSHFLAQLFLIL